MTPIDRSSLEKRDARRASGFTTIRVSHNVADALRLFEIPRGDRNYYERWRHQSADEKLSYLLLAPKLSTENQELPLGIPTYTKNVEILEDETHTKKSGSGRKTHTKSAARATHTKSAGGKSMQKRRRSA